MDQLALAEAFFSARRTKDTLPLIALPADPDRAWLRGLPDRHARWLRSQGADLDAAGLVLPVPGEDGRPAPERRLVVIGWAPPVFVPRKSVEFGADETATSSHVHFYDKSSTRKTPDPEPSLSRGGGAI